MGKFEEFIFGDTPVLVDFFATWCGPCKMMQPVLGDVKKSMGDKVHILKIDIDSPVNGSLVRKYNIRSVPTLLLFKKGNMVWRQSGFLPSNKLMSAINEA